MSDELKRYEMTTEYIGCGEYVVDCKEFAGGDWCDAEDALALLAKKDARIAELEAKIRDLTWWRPMHTMPHSCRAIVTYHGQPVIAWTDESGDFNTLEGIDYDDAEGWLPLPEVTP